MVDAPGTNGTAPKNTEPSSGVTSDEWEDLAKIFEQAFPDKEIVVLENGALPWSFRAQLTFAGLKHRFGIHTWIINTSYDANSKRMLDIGRACLLCDEFRNQ